MKKILLAEPGTRLSIFPPLGLLSIAAVLRENNFEVKIKDFSGEELQDVDARRLIDEFDPDIIGLHVLTGPNIMRALKISKIAKEANKLVVWGGPHPTVLPEQTLENQNIDAIVIGEGEHSFLDLIAYFSGENIAPLGCGVKKGKEKIILPPNPKIVDLDKLPLPAWDLLDNLRKYFPHKHHNELPISTARGCPFRCGFCHNSNENVKKYLGTYRIARPQKLLKEFEFVQGIVCGGVDSLNLSEDLHLVSKEYTKDFCRAMEESRLNLSWNTAARYTLFDDEMIKLISEANCREVLFGVESGSPRLQRMINKIVPMEQAIGVSKALRGKNILVTNAYIFGHPTETYEDLQMTCRYLDELPADQNLVQLYRPLPATPYFQLSVQLGKLTNIPQTLEDWANFGVLGYDRNLSDINSEILFSTFYKVNFKEQLRYLANLQKYNLRNKRYLQFAKTLVLNRFTFKLREYLESKRKNVCG